MIGRSRTLRVAWRDFKHTVLTKAFLFGVIGLPLLFTAVGGVAVLLIHGHEEPALVGTVAIVDPTGRIAPAAEVVLDPRRLADERRRQLEAMAEAAGELTGTPLDLSEAVSMPIPGAFGSMRIELEVEAHGAGADATDLRERVRRGDLVAVARFGPDVLEGGEDSESTGFELLLPEEMDPDHATVIERRLGDAVVRARLAGAGLDPERVSGMLERPRPRTTRLLVEGGETSEDALVRDLSRLIPIVFMMLIWISTFTTGQHLMMSTIEEKSNRVMEVLLSAVSPMQLLFGKILGQGLAGLIIVVVYASVGIAGLIAASRLHLVPPEQLVYLAIYFLMAYLMVSSIMAAVGSAVSDVREANSLLTPVMLILLFPLMLWLPISQDPNGAIGTTFSFIPPAIPFVMILRATADQPVPTWQIPVTIVWGFLCVLGMIWVGSRIFRIGVLMQGKPPSILQLLRWVRAG